MFRQLVLWSLVLLCPLIARAEAPPYIPLQGSLASADGRPVDGATKLRFRLYDRSKPSGDASEILYEEKQTVTVTDGLFTTYLGDGGKLSLSLFRDHAIVFVGVLVSDDAAELEPRLQLGTAPYAAFANACGDASTVAGKTYQEIVAAAQSGSSTAGGGAGPGAPGTTGPAGPKGDPGVLRVTATGRATAKLENQALTIDVPGPFGTLNTIDAPVSASGVSVFGWTQPAPAGMVCSVTVTSWYLSALSSQTGVSKLSLAVRAGDGTVLAPADLNLGIVPFAGQGPATVTTPFSTSRGPASFACSIDNGTGATQASCRVSVTCS